MNGVEDRVQALDTAHLLPRALVHAVEHLRRRDPALREHRAHRKHVTQEGRAHGAAHWLHRGVRVPGSDGHGVLPRRDLVEGAGVREERRDGRGDGVQAARGKRGLQVPEESRVRGGVRCWRAGGGVGGVEGGVAAPLAREEDPPRAEEARDLGEEVGVGGHLRGVRGEGAGGEGGVPPW